MKKLPDMELLCRRAIQLAGNSPEAAALCAMTATYLAHVAGVPLDAVFESMRHADAEFKRSVPQVES